MKKVRKDLPKFVWLERAFETISLSWVRGLIFMSCNLKCGNSKLLRIKHLSKFFKHYFRNFLTFISALVLCRSRSTAEYSLMGYCIVSY